MTLTVGAEFAGRERGKTGAGEGEAVMGVTANVDGTVTLTQDGSSVTVTLDQWHDVLQAFPLVEERTLAELAGLP